MSAGDEHASDEGAGDERAWRSPIYARCLAVVGGPSGELSIDCVVGGCIVPHPSGWGC